MLESRRELLVGLVGAAGLMSSASFARGRGSAISAVSPDSPDRRPRRTLRRTQAWQFPRAVAEGQELLRTDLDQLYRLVSELLKEYQSADAHTVLSVSFVKNAEQSRKTCQASEESRPGIVATFREQNVSVLLTSLGLACLGRWRPTAQRRA